MAKKIRVPKESQTYIGDTGPVRIKEIENAARRYVQFRDERQAAGEEEVRLKVKLISIMKENNLTTYDFDGFMVAIEHVNEDTVKVKKLRAAKDE